MTLELVTEATMKRDGPEYRERVERRAAAIMNREFDQAEASRLALAAISNPLRRRPSIKAFFKASAADPLLNHAASQPRALESL